MTGLALAAVGLLIATVLATSAYRREAQQRELAQAQRGRAEANFRRAQDAVDQMLTEVSEKSLAEIPQAQPVRRQLLEKAAVFYRELLAEQVSDPALRYESTKPTRGWRESKPSWAVSPRRLRHSEGRSRSCKSC